MDKYTFVQWIKENYSFSSLDRRNDSLVSIFRFKTYPSFISIQSPYIVEIINSLKKTAFFILSSEKKKEKT
jgi:hypothetical protein